MTWIFLIALLPFFILGLDVLANKHPLDKKEIERLIKKWQWQEGLRKHAYSIEEVIPNQTTKKNMRPDGEYLRLDESYYKTPSLVASFLKGKKHEWTVAVFVKNNESQYLWWNKGPDNAVVWLEISDEALTVQAFKDNIDLILGLHNHPNGVLEPSEQDYKSAKHYAEFLSENNISFIDFVCARGETTMYFANFCSQTIPTRDKLREIERRNGAGIWSNYFLRKELRRGVRRRYRSIGTIHTF